MSDSSGRGDVVAAGELWRDYQLQPAANAVGEEEEGVSYWWE